MKRSRLQFVLVAALLGLLGVLAFLQYVWLGQISDAERERMQRVVRSDTERFTEDFNREIQNAYFNFQTDAALWRDRNYREFNERYKFWREKTAYPELIKNIYFAEAGENPDLQRYDAQKGEFAPAEWTATIVPLKEQLAAANTPTQSIREEIPALILPIHEAPQKIDRILVRTPRGEGEEAPPTPREAGAMPPVIETPKRYGSLVVELDADVIKNRILPDLAGKYFGAGDGAEFQISVTDKNNQTVYQTAQISNTDAGAKFFNLSTDNFLFFANRDLAQRVSGERRRSVVFSTSTIETRTSDAEARADANASRMEVKVLDRDAAPKVRVFESEGGARSEGVWTLQVQHNAGSLEQFITNTRRKNLGVSFGILSLLGVSVLLIFVSTQRARRLAQRQVDFVSSVSHEFRTPLAVIYSAGENLADGVARDEQQVSRYGNLIKGEGKKLSAMVEQILEFAGAGAGKKKYDLRAQSVAVIIDGALGECRSLIEEKGFTVERDVAENLPEVKADAPALRQAIQNLIVNSVKYSNGEKYLKVSARNGGATLKIAVEDRGIGIAPDDLKHIFEPFYRAKAVVDEQIHGNGLGLSLVRETVRAHGGKISAKSEPGRGSTFTIELPLKKIP